MPRTANAHILLTARHWIQRSAPQWPMREDDQPTYRTCMATIVMAYYSWIVEKA